jgi:Kef-type K+ transport system membrane component KefB
MSPFLQLALALPIIVLTAKAGGWISVRLKQPAVLGELVAGLILGPTVINLLHLAPFVDQELLTEQVENLAEIGVIFLMFVAGMEVDVREMLRSGRVSALGGALGVVVPLVLGALAALPFGYQGAEALFVGIILTATSVSISAQTLLELGVLRTREGIALLGAAVVDDVLVILLLSVFLALSGGAGGAGDIAIVVLRMILYLAIASAAAWFVLPRLASWVQRQPISEGLIALIVSGALLFAWSAEAFGGLAAITGAFIAGVGLGHSTLREAVEGKMHVLTYGFFVPIFFVSVGLEANLRDITGPALPFLIVLFIVAVLSKVIGSGLGARLGGFTNRESLRLGLGMVSRGEVGLIVASVGVAEGIIAQSVFSVVVVLVLLTTLVTPILLRAVFPRTKASLPTQRSGGGRPAQTTPEHPAQTGQAAVEEN